jgi:hypothetical protein
MQCWGIGTVTDVSLIFSLKNFVLKCFFAGIISVRSTHLWKKAGFGPAPLTNGSGSESKRPKNMWIRFRIRISNTAAMPLPYECVPLKRCFLFHYPTLFSGWWCPPAQMRQTLRQDTLIHLIHVSVSAVTGDKTFFILCFFICERHKRIK